LAIGVLHETLDKDLIDLTHGVSNPWSHGGPCNGLFDIAGFMLFPFLAKEIGLPGWIVPSLGELDLHSMMQMHNPYYLRRYEAWPLWTWYDRWGPRTVFGLPLGGPSWGMPTY